MSCHGKINNAHMCSAAQAQMTKPFKYNKMVLIIPVDRLRLKIFLSLNVMLQLVSKILLAAISGYSIAV